MKWVSRVNLGPYISLKGMLLLPKTWFLCLVHYEKVSAIEIKYNNCFSPHEKKIQDTLPGKFL